MAPVCAYHIVVTTYGFWLPNDPRGSGSKQVRSIELLPFGQANYLETRWSVASEDHDHRLRRAAKTAIKYPEVTLLPEQVDIVGNAFAEQAERSQFRIYACAIQPQHTHLVIARHHYKIEQVGRILRQAATLALLDANSHPFADQRSPSGRLPSIWAQDFWRVFLFNDDDIQRSLDYCAGQTGQRNWDWLTPFEPNPIELTE
jgi:REP element-mobilizing transposase RayT